MPRRFPVAAGHFARWGLALWCGVAAMATAAPVAFDPPPVVEPPSAEHHTGKVIWADLVTPDLAGAKVFYGGVFGWTFKDSQAGNINYSVALLDGAPVGGMLQRPMRPDARRQPAWLTFLSVPDVAVAERTALAHGGRVLAPPRSFPQRGRQAVFADPQGAVFAVLQSNSGDPQDVLAAPGDWIWSSLVTRDPSTDAGFYQAIFGYEVFELPSDDGAAHVLFSTDQYARASSIALPAQASKLHPHWLNFLRVVSTPDAVIRVQALGGRVLVAPHPGRHGGLVAVVADPAGAPFGLLEWTDADAKDAPR
jgi:uncharacterized protein